VRSKHTLLLVDQEMCVSVDQENEHVRQDIDTSNNVHNIRIFQRNFLRYLHHPKHDDQVCSVQFCQHRTT
jgi:hypothetical protein